MNNIISNKAEETQRLGKDFAEKILQMSPEKQAVVLALQGQLGAGKTTFLQGFADGLGIKEKVLSPTFVIMKKYKIANNKYNAFYHIDCYRLKSEGDAKTLELKEIFAEKRNIVAIEWAENIKTLLPKPCLVFTFNYKNNNKREILWTIKSL